MSPLLLEKMTFWIRQKFSPVQQWMSAALKMLFPLRPLHKKLLLAISILAVASVLLRFPEPRTQEAPISFEAYRFEILPANTDLKCSISHEQRLAAVCADTTCGKNFLLQFKHQQQQPPVPAIRHILWKSEYVSDYFLRQLKSWQRVHPNWTFVLWRDSDLEPFVRKHFPGKIYQKFKTLPTTGVHGIKRIDMFRYMLLYKFGGVYADLDYILVDSLDTYRRYPAVVTREPEAHAVQLFGLKKWPLPIMANPAFFMSAPGHPFFIFALHELVERDAFRILEFAGPLGLSQMLSMYYQMHMTMVRPAQFVYIPPSFSFYPYTRNRLDAGGSEYMTERIQTMQRQCQEASNSIITQVQEYCIDVLNLDPITDKTQPMVAVHDTQKKRSVYVDENTQEFVAHMMNALVHFKGLKIGAESFNLTVY